MVIPAPIEKHKAVWISIRFAAVQAQGATLKMYRVLQDTLLRGSANHGVVGVGEPLFGRDSHGETKLICSTSRQAGLRQQWMGSASAFVIAVLAGFIGGADPASAKCKSVGPNQFEISGVRQVNIDTACVGATDGATFFVDGLFISSVVEDAAAPNSWKVLVSDRSLLTNIGDPSATRPAISSSGRDFSLENFGSITSITWSPVSVAGAGDVKVTNRAGGRIVAQGSGIALSGVDLLSRGTNNLINEAGAVIGGEHAGVAIANGTGFISNSGIIGGDDSGVRFLATSPGGSIVNTSGGSIFSSKAAVPTIAFDAPGVVINGGTISNKAGGSAIEFATYAFDDVLALAPGFSITGAVDADLGTDTFRFVDTGGSGGTGVFNLDLIDDGSLTRQYRNFDVFEVTGGTWQFQGSFVGFLGVSGSGVFGGTPTVAGLEVTNGGTIAPGNSIGTIISSGDVSFGDNTTFQVEVDAVGNSDLLQVTGAGTPIGISSVGTTLDVVAAPGLYDLNQIYTIATAGVVNGQFTTVQDNLPDIDFTALYDGSSIRLGLTGPASGGSSSGGSSSGGSSSGSGGSSPQSPKAVFPAALNTALYVERMFVNTMRRRAGLTIANGGTGVALASNHAVRFIEGRGAGKPMRGVSGRGVQVASSSADDVAKYAAGSANGSNLFRDWGVWGALMGRTVKTNNEGALPGWKTRIGGMALGAERGLTVGDRPVVVGVAGAYSHANTEVEGSDVTTKTYHAGAYAAGDLGSLSLSGAVSYSWEDYDFERRIPFGGSGALTANGSADGYSFSASAEGFYDMSDVFNPVGMFGDWAEGAAFGPLATVTFVDGDRDGFTERGAGILNLTVSGEDMQQTVTGLGLALQFERLIENTHVTFEGRAAWEHVLGDRQGVTRSTLSSVGASFTAGSAPEDKNRLALGLGSVVNLSDAILAHLRYDSALSDDTRDHQASLDFTVKF